MRVLVTGSSGFIGSVLCDKLIRDGINVRGFDLHNNSEKKQSIEFFCGDINNIEVLRKAVASVDAVIHLIAMHHDFGVSRDEYFEVNENGTKRLLDCCSEAGVKKFVFFSSVAVYGTQLEPTTESTTPCPDTFYGSSKLAAEKVVMKWYEEDRSRNVVIIRPTVVYGPNNYANVYNLINQIYRKHFYFIGNGSNVKSVAYVDNLVEAIKFLLGRISPGVEIYNYADEPQLTTRRIVEIISNCLNVSVPKLKIPYKIAVVLASVFDVLGKLTGYNFPITGSRIKKFCTATHHKADKIIKEGFRAPVPLEEGFRRMIKWYLAFNSKEPA